MTNPLKVYARIAQLENALEEPDLPFVQADQIRWRIKQLRIVLGVLKDIDAEQIRKEKVVA